MYKKPLVYQAIYIEKSKITKYVYNRQKIEYNDTNVDFPEEC